MAKKPIPTPDAPKIRPGKPPKSVDPVTDPKPAKGPNPGKARPPKAR